MKIKSIFFVLAIMVLFVGLSMILPLIFAFAYKETAQIFVFLSSMGITLGVGMALYNWTKGNASINGITNKEGMLIGAVGWLVIPLFGSLPYIFSGTLPNLFDAYFESISGFTTTGATVMTDIEAAAKSILLWRSFTQWLGAMGILLLFVALMSKMGIGGTRLLKAETPGPTVSKIVPRVSQYAKYIWIVYISLTVIEVIILTIVGLDFFDALNHTFTSIATGGFSTRNAGVGAFENYVVDFIIILFMIIGGGNFALYYLALSKKDPGLLFKDEEYRSYLIVLFLGFVIAAINLYLSFFNNTFEAVRYGLFQIVSLLTGAGHVNYDYDRWGSTVKMTLFVLMFFGGCQYSTTGGIKMVRMLIAAKFIGGELAKNLHPRIVYQIRINKLPVNEQVTNNVIGFFLLYFIFFFLTALLLAGYGFDKVSSLTASAAILGNVGPAMGIFGPTQTYFDMPNMMKLWLSLVMIMGRLEIYPMLALMQVLVFKRNRSALIKS